MTLVRFPFNIDATIQLPFVPAVKKKSIHSLFGTALSNVHSVAYTGTMNVAILTKMWITCVRYV